MAEKITWASLFDFSNASSVKDAIKSLKALDKAYDAFIKTAVEGSKTLKDSNAQLVKSLDGTEKAVKALNETEKTQQATIEKTNAELKALSATYDAQKKEVKSLEVQVKKLSKERTVVAKKTKDLNNINKESIKLEAKLGKLTGEEAKEVAGLKLQISALSKKRSIEAKEAAGLVTIYQKESARLNDLRKKYKDVALAQGLNSKAAKRLLAALTPLDAKLKGVDASVGQFQRNVGGYRQALSGLTVSFSKLAGALGFTGLIFAFVAAFKDAFVTVKNFQKGNAVLAGVLNKTTKEIVDLTDDSKKLGATTAKSATEVNKLQIAYARLGFTQQEIIELTSDTIDGSIALNAELSETAELTGAMVRTFDELSTTDAGSILDSLTLSTQKSALNFQKLQTALPIVAGAANAAGISFTRTVALLGKLSDAGIDASSSATSLRNIFIESASQGLNYEQILTKIGNSQDQLTASNDEFGKRAAVSSSILSNLVEEVGNFDEALQNAGGTAERVAKQQLNTLSGDIDLLASSWDGWILSIDSGDGAISKFVRGSLQALTSLLNKLNTEIDQAASPADLLFEELKEGSKTVAELDVELIRLEATITASGRAATKQKEAIRGNTNAIKDAKIAYEEWVFIQAEGNKLIDSGLGIPELTDKLNELQSRVSGNTRGSKAFQQSQKEIAEEILAVAAALSMLTAEERALAAAAAAAADGQGGLSDSVERLDSSLRKLNNTFRIAEERQAIFAKASKESLNDIFGGDESVFDNAVLSANEMQEGIKTALDKAGVDFANFEQGATDATVANAAKRAAIRDTAFQGADIIGNQLFENNRIRSENQLKAFENEKNFELALAGDNAQRRAQIEADFARKERKIRIEQAQAAKKQALFNIILNTAQAVTAALTIPPPAGPILAIANGVIGAIQLAAVASQPLPAFEDGGLVKTDGQIVTSEKGTEMFIDKRGKIGFTGDKGPEVRTGMKGSTIIPADLTKDIVNKGFDHSQINQESSMKITQVLVEQRDRQTQILAKTMAKETDILAESFDRSLKKIPRDVFNVSDGDLKRVSIKGTTTRRDWMNKVKG